MTAMRLMIIIPIRTIVSMAILIRVATMTRILVITMVVGPDRPQQHDAAIPWKEDGDSKSNDGDDNYDTDDADNRIEPRLSQWSCCIEWAVQVNEHKQTSRQRVMKIANVGDGSGQ